MGVVLIILGFIDHAGKELSGLEEKALRSKLTVALLLIGGYGFLAMFYWGGANSVPRRYAIYPQEVMQGTLYARVAVGFVTILLCGILLYFWKTGKRCFKALSWGPEQKPYVFAQRYCRNR